MLGDPGHCCDYGGYGQSFMYILYSTDQGNGLSNFVEKNCRNGHLHIGVSVCLKCYYANFAICESLSVVVGVCVAVRIRRSGHCWFVSNRLISVFSLLT